MKPAPDDIPPAPEDDTHFVAFLKEVAHTSGEPPPPQVLEWRTEILAAATRSTETESQSAFERGSVVPLVPFTLRLAWAALWITAAGFHLITPEPPINTPPVRRPSAASFQQLTRNGQSLRTITPLVRFHALKRELQLR
jgi:hypothetical protein